MTLKNQEVVVCSMREQSSNLQREDRKAYAEQVLFSFCNIAIFSRQVALAFYKAIGGGSEDEADPI